MKNKQMSHQQNQQNSRIYKEPQDHIYDIHAALQELTACIGSIHNSLIRLSSALLYLNTYTSSEPHTNKFAIACRSLHISIHQLANVNFDLTKFRDYLIPFNKQTPTSPSFSSSTVSEESSYAEDSLGSLLEDTVNCNRTTVVGKISILPICLLYTATIFGPPPPEVPCAAVFTQPALRDPIILPQLSSVPSITSSGISKLGRFVEGSA